MTKGKEGARNQLNLYFLCRLSDLSDLSDLSNRYAISMPCALLTRAD
jgi:hypothetical protein